MKLRFLLHSVYGSHGGVVRVALNLVEDLKTHHDVELVSLFRQRRHAKHALPDGVPVTTLVDGRPRSAEDEGAPARHASEARPSRLVPPSESRYGKYSEYTDAALEEYLTSVDDGVVIGMQPGMIAAIAQLASPSVVRVGQEHRSIRGRSKDLLDEALPHYAKLDLFLTLTERDAAVYRSRYLPDTAVAAMPNGIPEYRGTVSDGTRKVVVAAGRLSHSKGFDRLLDAWASVSRSHPDWQLRIFGEGGSRDALAQQIRVLGIESSASLMGYSTRIRDEMAAASIFALSSRAEGYPMVILEAMSCGLPVVAFDCLTGPREMITHGTDGLLVPDGDVEGLADALSSLISKGPAGRREMGQAAVLKAQQHSQRNIGARWESVLRPLVDAKSRPSTERTAESTAPGSPR
jgi:glycosyltransferase involved in cell wall biosynthesis